MALGTGWVLAAVGGVALGILTCRRFKGSALLAGVTASGLAAVLAGSLIHKFLTALPVFGPHNHATVIYRLRAFEMNEPEFFAWWPLRLVLLLFVANMVWATVRRIEFSVPRIGVLMVHSGIVTMALGAVYYGVSKVEGDMFITRADLPGAQPVNVFYDRNDPALYVSLGAGFNGMAPHQMSLDALPRYNDYADGELNLKLHESPGFADRFGQELQITVPAFFAYAEFQRVWQAAPSNPANSLAALSGPVLTMTPGDAQTPSHDTAPLHFAAARPADRVSETPDYAVEYLHNPSAQRLNDLNIDTPFAHALLVEIPAQQHHEVVSITPGQTLTLGNTGYSLTIEDVGPYGMPFISSGYRGARDTQATVTITRPVPLQAGRRIVLHRYPERTQEFVNGKRGDPNPDIRLVYLDNTKPQIRLITRDIPNTPANAHDAPPIGPPQKATAKATEETTTLLEPDPQAPQLDVLLRLPGFAPAFGAA